MIEGLALRTPPPTVAFVHRQVREIALAMAGLCPTTNVSIGSSNSSIPALITLAHDGSKTYRTTYDLLYRREAEKPNEIWQADHTLLDLWVRQDGAPGSALAHRHYGRL